MSILLRQVLPPTGDRWAKSLAGHPELQNLHAELIDAGSKSLDSALAVGVLIEETDIRDLADALITTRDKAIRNVFTNLLNGSYHHLAAFESALQ